MHRNRNTAKVTETVLMPRVIPVDQFKEVSKKLKKTAEIVNSHGTSRSYIASDNCDKEFKRTSNHLRPNKLVPHQITDTT